jgi:hypothetical protein
MMTRTLCALLTAMLLCGCQSIYRPQSGNEPFGYQDTRLSDTEYRISFESWRSGDRTRLRPLAEYRAAELGASLGYGWMQIVEADYVMREDAALGNDAAPITRGAGASSGVVAEVTPGMGMRQMIYEVSLRVRYLHEQQDDAINLVTVLARPLP